jgi:hypothetical protein
MASVAGPYGLAPARKYLGDTPFSSGMHTYQVLTNQTTGMFFGDPVGIDASGNVQALSASPAPGAQPLVLGAFMGAEWQDPFRGFVNAQFLPANIITSGAWDVRIKVFDYPWAIFRVQADGSVDYTSVGRSADLGNFGAGSVWTGNSQITLVSGSIGAGQAVRIYDLVVDAAPSPGAGSLPGDAYTDCLVIWNFGVSRWLSAA